MTTTAAASAVAHPAREASRQDLLLAPCASPRRPGALAASVAFGWRAMLKIKHEPKQLVDVTAVPALLTLLFTYLFGGALGGSPRHYLTLLVPGTMVMGVTIVTMYGGARLADDLSTGVFDRFRSLPVWRGAFVAGGLLADVGRYFLAAGIVATLGVAIGYRPDGGAPGVLAAMALVVAFGVSLSWVWTIVALLILDSATVMSLASIVVFPSPSPATSSSQPAPCPAGCRLSSPPTRSATLPARPAPS
ncbi:MAG: ABC transporter permease [Actinomycetota bacterium]|nr:ABC transporter permease [Actinomycetota bacterium]